MPLSLRLGDVCDSWSPEPSGVYQLAEHWVKTSQSWKLLLTEAQSTAFDMKMEVVSILIFYPKYYKCLF